MPENKNTIADLKRFLGTDEQPVSMEEFNVFWKSCSEEEKQEFKSTELK